MVGFLTFSVFYNVSFCIDFSGLMTFKDEGQAKRRRLAEPQEEEQQPRRDRPENSSSANLLSFPLNSTASIKLTVLTFSF